VRKEIYHAAQHSYCAVVQEYSWQPVVYRKSYEASSEAVFLHWLLLVEFQVSLLNQYRVIQIFFKLLQRHFPGQPGLLLNEEAGGPACSGKIGAWWSLRSLPTQAIPWFHDSITISSFAYPSGTRPLRINHADDLSRKTVVSEIVISKKNVQWNLVYEPHLSRFSYSGTGMVFLWLT